MIYNIFTAVSKDRPFCAVGASGRVSQLGLLLSLAAGGTSFAQGDTLTQSTIRVPIRVTVPSLQTAIDQAVPVEESGTRPAGIGKPIVDDTFSWSFRREPIELFAGEGSLTATTVIRGSARVAGAFQPIRGDAGKLLGKLGKAVGKTDLSKVPFSAHVDILASVSARATPTLTTNWRLAARLEPHVDITEANIPILHATHISVRGKLEPIINEKLGELTDKLNAKLAEDSSVELAAGKAWSDICRSQPLGGDKPLWLNIQPRIARASQPVIDQDGVSIVIGLSGEIDVTDERPATLDCRPLPSLTLEPPARGFQLVAPVTVGYDRLAALLTPLAVETPLKAAGSAFRVSSLELAGESERFAVTIGVKSGGGFFAWLLSLFRPEHRIVIKATPMIDASTRKLAFANVAVDNPPGESDATVSLAAPILARWLEENARVDLLDIEQKARERAIAAMKALKEKGLGDLRVSQADVTEVALQSVSAGLQGLEAKVAASGDLALEIIKLTLKN